MSLKLATMGVMLKAQFKTSNFTRNELPNLNTLNHLLLDSGYARLCSSCWHNCMIAAGVFCRQPDPECRTPNDFEVQWLVGNGVNQVSVQFFQYNDLKWNLIHSVSWLQSLNFRAIRRSAFGVRRMQNAEWLWSLVIGREWGNVSGLFSQYIWP